VKLAEGVSPDDWYIAGYEGADGNWYDVEAGDQLPDFEDIQLGDEMVVAFTDDDDVTHYWTLHGGFEDYEAIADAIADLADLYGVG
jgi:hypothetical protein